MDEINDNKKSSIWNIAFALVISLFALLSIFYLEPQVPQEVSVPSTIEEAQVRYPWKIQQGEILRYRYSEHVSWEASGADSYRVSNNVEMYIALEGQDVEGEELIIDFTYERIKGHFELPSGGALDFDSAVKSNIETDNPVVRFFEVLVGSKIAVRMTSAGEIKEFRGYEDVMDGFNANYFSPTVARISIGPLIDAFGEASIRMLFSSFTKILPPPGVMSDTWEGRISQPQAFVGSLDYPVRFSLSETKLASAETALSIGMISDAGSLSENVDQGGGIVAGVMRRGSRLLESSLGGSFTFSVDKGHLLQGDISSSVNALIGAGSSLDVRNTGVEDEIRLSIGTTRSLQIIRDGE
ncbi:MAG: DUF6263 family protein [bacterium]|nr:DUF6263 family protein [bacterium]